MYKRSSLILDECFKNYKLMKLDENSVFMSGRVLCRTAKTIYFVTKLGDELNLSVHSVGDLKNIKSGDLVANLEISDKNGLILRENLYSIIDR